MNGINRQQLFGNLGADPELRFTQGGQAVLNMRVATTTGYFDKKKDERVERTDWHSVVVWGPRAEALAKLLVKGSTVYIEGETRHSEYEDKEGQKRWKTEVHASEVLLAGGKRAEGGDDRPRDSDRGRGRDDRDDDRRTRGRDDDRRRDDRKDDRRRDERGGRDERRQSWE